MDARELERQEFVARIRRLIEGVERTSETVSFQSLEEMYERLDVILTQTVAAAFTPQADIDGLATVLQRLRHSVRNRLERLNARDSYRSVPVYSGERGRPLLHISEDQLGLFLSLNFTVRDMASILQCSERTVHRRLSAFGLSVRGTFSSISDAHLDAAVAEINRNFPRHGYRNVIGHLQAIGIRVPRRRVRQSLCRVDPEGACLRWAYTIQRRSYSVSGPNALWHIDGLRALIRWGIVIHGGIDGYSRMPVFLRCSANNKSSSVLYYFLTAVEEFGVPSRVRGDRGTEKIAVAEWMISTKGTGRGSYI